MRKKPLFEVDPRYEAEAQVDAMFARTYALVADGHRKMIEGRERDIFNALKAAMRLPAIEPLPPTPNGGPAGSCERLAIFLSPAQRGEVRKARERRQ